MLNKLHKVIKRLKAAFSMLVFTLKGGESTMVAVYIALITYQVYTIANVPAQLKDAVLAALEAIGLDGYGQEIEGE